jgi:ParB family chromosome partitioning protein
VAKRVGQKIKMTSIDELLCVPSVAGCDEIEVAKIRPFKDHPFKVLDDEKMHELVESIMLNGVLTPVIVRKIENIRNNLCSRSCNLADVGSYSFVD